MRACVSPQVEERMRVLEGKLPRSKAEIATARAAPAVTLYANGDGSRGYNPSADSTMKASDGARLRRHHPSAVSKPNYPHSHRTVSIIFGPRARCAYIAVRCISQHLHAISGSGQTTPTLRTSTLMLTPSVAHLARAKKGKKEKKEKAEKAEVEEKVEKKENHEKKEKKEKKKEKESKAEVEEEAPKKKRKADDDGGEKKKKKKAA
eukprot:4042353-Pleurochrysis_carterae.AAC.2